MSTQEMNSRQNEVDQIVDSSIKTIISTTIESNDVCDSTKNIENEEEYNEVYGPSMLPTLNFTGDVLLVDKLSPMLGKVGPGDVVLVRSPENPRKTITKRIVGLEGDIVTFLVDPGRSDLSHSLVVPKGHVWIQGDNIYASNDSRHIGPVPYGLILGKVFCRVWPPQDFGRLAQ